MRKVALIVFLSLFSWLSAQVVTTNPAFITENEVIEVIFDATQGNKGMMGATDCYAHTGLITNKSSGTSDWRYAPEWKDNSEKYKMTSVGTNTWKLTITPDILAYYGVTDPTEKVKYLAFVFRNADASKEGKETDGGDILVKVPQKVEFISPDRVTVTGTTNPVSFEISSSENSKLTLFLNDVNSTPLASAENAQSLTHSQTLSKGDYYFIAQALQGTEIYRDTVYVCSFSAPFSKKTRPTGTKEGVNRNADGSVTFCVFAPNTSSAFLLSDFNDYKPSVNYVMNYDYEGTLSTQRYYWITIEGLNPNTEYGYQYLVDRTIRIADPYSEKILDPWNDKWIESYVYPNLKPYPVGKTEDPVTTFTINQTEYQWQVSDFAKRPSDELIIYEMLFRDFTTEGTVNAAIAKLDYLKELGVTAVELMPIQEFDGNDSWGYNPNFYFAADKAYGTAEDYKRFVDECHKRGMAVILDVVFNHSWGQFPWCKLYWDSANNRPASNNPFYNAVAPHPYSVGNDFKHSNVKVREYFKNVLQYWMQKYKMDGFRFDLTKGFTDNHSTAATAGNYDETRIGYLKEYNAAIKEIDSDAYTILEHFCEEREESALAGDGMMLWRNLNKAYSQAAMGQSIDSNFSGMFASGQMPAGSLVGYMESHDEERMAYKAKENGTSTIKGSLETRMQQLACNAAFSLTVPGPKMIWQFGEYGYDISIDENGRTGRKPVLWEYLDVTERATLANTYSKLLALRRSYPDLFSSAASFQWNVSSGNWPERILKLEKDGKILVVVGNFGETSLNYSNAFPSIGTWYDYFGETTLNVTSTSQQIPLSAHVFKLYTNFEPEITSDIETNEYDNTNFFVYPNPVTDLLRINLMDVSSIDIYSANGILLKKVENQNEINVSDLPSGYYIIRAVSNMSSYSTTFIKK